jgi:hypothetical protein
MNAAKQEGWAGFILAPLRHLLRPLSGGSRGLFVAVALAILMIVGAYVGWSKWGPAIAGRQRYVLTVDSLEIPPQPTWIPADIKAEVMRDGSLTGLSVLDPELTSQVARAFELNTWVSRVNRVVKRSGTDAPRVIIELEYRRPVVMVKTRNGFWPVDSEGVLLPPDDFSPSQTRSYLRVVTENLQPAGPIGTPYGDPGINGAARIAAAIDGIWADAGLQWIVVRKELPIDASQATQSNYLLYPVGNAPPLARTNSNSPVTSLASDSSTSEPTLEVRWGHAPGLELAGEATCTQKITRLEQFLQDYGPLHEQTGVKVIDLRPGSGLSIVGKKNSFEPASLR